MATSTPTLVTAGAGIGDESVFIGQLQGTGGDTPTNFLFDAALDGTTDTVGDRDDQVPGLGRRADADRDHRRRATATA